MNTDISPGEGERTKEDIAKEYLERGIDQNDLLDLASGWEKKVFFNRIEDAWPGFKIVEIDDEERSSNNFQYLGMISEQLNKIYETTEVKERAFLCKDDKGAFIMLKSEIGETGEKLIQKARAFQLRYGGEGDPYEGILLVWTLDSLIIESSSGDEVILFDYIVNHGDSNTIVVCKDLFGDIKEEDERVVRIVMGGYDSKEDQISILNPSLKKRGITTFLHELGHAFDYRVSGDEINAIREEARRIVMEKYLGVRSKPSQERNLSLKSATEVMIKEERTAWTVTLKLLKLLNEGSKSQNLQFGNLNHRRMVEEIVEESLKTYDDVIEKSLGSLGFSQHRRESLHTASQGNKVKE